MTLSQAEPKAIALLRDIIEGDDATMSRALEEGRQLLQLLRVSTAKPGEADHLDIILALAADRYGYTVAALKSRERTARLVTARQVGMWLCRQVTNASLQEIGGRLARDHGTVIHGVQSMQDAIDTDPKFKAQMNELRAKATALCGRTGQ